MRLVAIPILAFGLIAASDGEKPSSLDAGQANEKKVSEYQPVDTEASGPERAFNDDAAATISNCPKAPTVANDEGNSSLFQRGPASNDSPLAIYAVDLRQDGCSVMLMMGSRGDIRPLPTPAQVTPSLFPLDSDQ